MRLIYKSLLLCVSLLLLSNVIYTSNDIIAAQRTLATKNLSSSLKYTLAPNFKLQDINGKTISLSNFKGKKNIFLNFWASSCPPCKIELPYIQSIYDETKKTDTIVLTINCDGYTNSAKKIMKEKFYTFPVLFDLKGSVQDSYDIISIPTSILIDKKGYIRAKHYGLMSQADMSAAIKKLSKN